MQQSPKLFPIREFKRAGKKHVIEKVPMIQTINIPAASISNVINNMHKERLTDAVYGKNKKSKKQLERKLKVLRQVIKKEKTSSMDDPTYSWLYSSDEAEFDREIKDDKEIARQQLKELELMQQVSADERDSPDSPEFLLPKKQDVMTD